MYLFKSNLCSSCFFKKKKKRNSCAVRSCSIADIFVLILNYSQFQLMASNKYDDNCTVWKVFTKNLTGYIFETHVALHIQKFLNIVFSFSHIEESLLRLVM